MRFVATSILALVVFVLVLSPILARPTRSKQKTITAYVTFHDASPDRNTTFGRQQQPWMAALNRKKDHHLMCQKIIPHAYIDKKTGKEIPIKLSKRRLADVMGPTARKDPNYRVDYYLDGPMPSEYDKYNKTIWIFTVAD